MSNQKSENVFSNRNFRLVFLGALVSELGALLYSFAVSFYILEISGNSAANGLLSSRQGGGAYIASGCFTMNGGAITGNTADGEGGGVYITGSSNHMFHVSGSSPALRPAACRREPRPPSHRTTRSFISSRICFPIVFADSP